MKDSTAGPSGPLLMPDCLARRSGPQRHPVGFLAPAPSSVVTISQPSGSWAYPLGDTLTGIDTDCFGSRVTKGNAVDGSNGSTALTAGLFGSKEPTSVTSTSTPSARIVADSAWNENIPGLPMSPANIGSSTVVPLAGAPAPNRSIGVPSAAMSSEPIVPSGVPVVSNP